ncbi:hypothetical protein DBR28_03390 [Chryseobacterium sp. HMWF028]|nr:hypothetical protein DBR28_03390 [Chryseobacterium sp. HMWF028]
MKLKHIFSIAFIVAYNVTWSQVGILTENPQGSFHIDGAKDNNPSASPTLIQQSNDFVVTQNGKVGVGNLIPVTKLDSRSNPGNIVPGEGAIGVGETAATAANAGAGAIRYNPVNNNLEYSNGEVWNKIDGRPPRALVYGHFAGGFGNSLVRDNGAQLGGGSGTLPIDPVGIHDASNSVVFIYNTPGYPNQIKKAYYVVPRSGNYFVSFCYLAHNDVTWVINQEFSGRIAINDVDQIIGFWKARQSGTNQPAGNCTQGVISASAGDRISFRYYLDIDPDRGVVLGSAGFNNFRILEL